MLDINYIMEELKKERYCFTSEADMQFAFSWKAKELYGECEIIFEQFSVLDIEGKSSYIDLIIRYKGKDYPIEFKYITSSMEYLHFNLKNHSARNLRSYDIIKDLTRIEKYCLQKKLKRGYVVVITNDNSYWKPYSQADSETDYYDFNLGEGRILNGELRWKKNKAKKGRKLPLTVSGSYKVKWNDYSQIDTHNGIFKSLILETSLPEEIKRGKFTTNEQEKLYKYLKEIDKDNIILSFDDLKNITGFPFPDSAVIYNVYWSDKNRKHAVNSWIKAGYFAKLQPLISSVEFYKCEV